jgi:hypothetical protein
MLSLLGILEPCAGALLDPDFKNAVAHASYQLNRIHVRRTKILLRGR